CREVRRAVGTDRADCARGGFIGDRGGDVAMGLLRKAKQVVTAPAKAAVAVGKGAKKAGGALGDAVSPGAKVEKYTELAMNEVVEAVEKLRDSTSIQIKFPDLK